MKRFVSTVAALALIALIAMPAAAQDAKKKKKGQQARRQGGPQIAALAKRLKEAELTDEQKAALKGKQVTFPRTNETEKWYDLLVEVEGDTLTVSIDGEEVGSFSSEGIAHPTKRMLRLSVPKDAIVDDVKIWRKK